MTAKKKTAVDLGIDPEAEYQVQLARAVKLGSTTLSPKNPVTLLGAALVGFVNDGAVKEYVAAE